MFAPGDEEVEVIVAWFINQSIKYTEELLDSVTVRVSDQKVGCLLVDFQYFFDVFGGQTKDVCIYIMV